ncbi:MAG: helix-turn-helix domain-containing protein [Halolamina sp.]|uniref:winged helix-turn-helix domain-containing protein n=1 Tax=Halolamina sp. TaxID=1940283 RepID=UPI002FC2F5CE
MVTSSGESPLEEAAGAADRHATEAFELLANETRLAILLALWNTHEPFAGDDALSFSELRDRVGMRDSGQFNYHLGKLEGEFVKSTEKGYKLRPAGKKIIWAVIAGVGLENPTLERTEIGISCPLCDASTAITYRDGRLFQLCTECSGHYSDSDEFPPGTLFTWRFEPAGLNDRTPEEVYAAASLGMLHQSLAMIEGTCPECSGAVTPEIEVCDEHDPGIDDVCPNCGRQDQILTLYQCSVCKFGMGGAPSGIVSQHPAVIAFYYDHGVNFQYNLDFEQVKRVLELGESHEHSLESMDPLRVRVTVQYEGDEMELVLDEKMNVLEVID